MVPGNKHMIELNKDGFLGEPAKVWSRSFRKVHGSLLKYCKQLNRDVHSLLYSLDVHNKDGREVINQEAFAFLKRLSQVLHRSKNWSSEYDGVKQLSNFM
jgi:hypothetical protein